MTFIQGGGMLACRVYIDRNQKLVMWYTGHQWIHYKALADDDCIWLLTIANG